MDQINQLLDLFIPVSAIVFGLVEFFKSTLNIEGKAVTFLSFIIGIVIGGAVFATTIWPEISQYVYGFLFVITAGLVSSGFYKFGASFKR